MQYLSEVDKNAGWKFSNLDEMYNSSIRTKPCTLRLGSDFFALIRVIYPRWIYGIDET